MYHIIKTKIIPTLITLIMIVACACGGAVAYHMLGLGGRHTKHAQDNLAAPKENPAARVLVMRHEF